MKYVLLPFVLFLAACPPLGPSCLRPNEFRCNENVLEICDPDNHWHEHTDCSDLPGIWACDSDGVDADCQEAE